MEQNFITVALCIMSYRQEESEMDKSSTKDRGLRGRYAQL